MNFNNLEIGAVLAARAKQMMDRDLIFGATFDGHSDSTIRSDVDRTLCQHYDMSDHKDIVDGLMALDEEQLLQHLAGAV